MQRARRVDSNQKLIVETLRAGGARVIITSGVGSIGGHLSGFPDIVIGYSGRTILGEIKTPAGKLTEAEHDFMTEWTRRGDDYVILRSVEDVLSLLTALRE